MERAEGGERVLVVDDNPGITLLLQQLLKAEGYAVAVARDGRQALEAVASHRPELVLLDLDMPGMGGFEVCAHLKQDPATRLIPVVIITSQGELQARLRAWELGADDFLAKPFESLEVLARCRSLLRVKRLVDELDSAQEVLFAFARAVEARCRFTFGHAKRVTEWATRLAARVGLAPAEIEVLRRGALLHDIGKIGIADAILNKPARLTAEEYREIQRHPERGAHIIEPLRSLRDTIPLIRWHHERLDGRGYPDRLRGDAIPLLVRILSVADVYDALSTWRPYRDALSAEECVRTLRGSAAEGGLDPELVECFVGLLAERGARSRFEQPARSASDG
ncbi:MAG TPA: HD domain-containing phosphohydrolase [Gemmataceae bacterium]|nr:HD domain-containing phosphohydrolase [Gemmataceae bacterium]